MKRFFSKISVLLVIVLLAACNPDYDTVITNGTIYDGLGGEPYTSSIALKDGKIVKIGNFRPNAQNVIDAEGMIIAPGFIDIHTHIDRGIVKPENSAVQNYLTQGVSTVVTGNCGSGTWEVDEYFSRLDSIGIGPNVVHLIGHGTIRRATMGSEDRAPTTEEMDQMNEYIIQGMKEGAVGMSTGLFYSPGSFSETEEVIELAKMVNEHNGIYASHIRDESNYNIGVVASVAEAIEIGEKSGTPVQISHIKALGTPVWDLSDEICELIEKAQVRGVNVMADQYPYPASSTGLAAATVPRWVQEGGKMKERLQDDKLLDSIKSGIEENVKRRGGPESIVLVSYAPKPEYGGLNLAEISEMAGKPVVDMIIELVLNDRRPSIVSFNMKESDVEFFMQKDYVMTSSDGSVQTMGRGVPHPRSYGTYPHKIRNYVLEDSLVTMEHAIRAASYLPAQMLGLTDRGQVKEGFVADLVIFDPETIKDLSTFSDPHQYSQGIEFLLLHGEAVIEQGEYNGKKTGRTLRMNEYLN